MLASTWFDLVVGVDIHFEMVPTPAPVPTPFPHPFVGLVFDPAGLAIGLAISNAIGLIGGGSFKGPVLINCMPANTTGTEAKNSLVLPHFIIPPGTMWTPMPKAPPPKVRPGGPPPIPGNPVAPAGDAMMITGSKTVHTMGSNQCRLGDLAMSCAEPVRLPSSAIIAIPKGMPVIVGGPPAVDWMAAAQAFIKTKSVANLLYGWTGKLRAGRLRNIANWAVCTLTGHPVDVGTGRLLTRSLDLEVASGLPIRFERHYASSWTHRDSTVGFGWSHSYDESITLEPGKAVWLGPEGRELEIDLSDLPGTTLHAKESRFDPIHRLTLECLDVFRWRLTDGDGVVREFARVDGEADPTRARLIRMADRQGRELRFSYDAAARLEWIVASADRSVQLTYDRDGRVSELRAPHPSQPGWLTHHRYEYSDDGDLVAATGPMGTAMRYEYDGHLLVRETDRGGFSFYFGYDGRGPEAYCVRTWGDGGVFDHEIVYDKRKHVAAVTDSLDHTRLYRFNEVNLLVEETDPHGHATSYEYDGFMRRVAVIDPLGAESRREYDARGNLVKSTTAAGLAWVFTYDDRDRRTAARSPAGPALTWAYDDQNRLVEERDAAGRVARFFHGRDGERAATRPDGQRIVYRVDAHDEVVSARYPDGLVVQMERDRLGRLVATRAGGKVVSRRRYDADGRLLRIDPTDGTPAEFAYDAAGNLVRQADATGVITYTYAGWNQLVAREAGGATVRTEYDSELRRTAVINEHGEAHRWTLDPNGLAIREEDFDGRVTRMERDAAGRTVRRTDPAGGVTSMTYDLDGRPLTIARPDGSEESLVWGPDGQLAEAHNADTSVLLEYDRFGRLVRELQGDEWVEWERDALGRITSTASSRGLRRATTPSWDGRQETERIELDGRRWEIDRRLDDRGAEVQRRLPGGVTVTRTPGPSGLPGETLATQDAVGLSAVLIDSYDAALRTRSTAMIPGGERALVYDARSRVFAEEGADGTAQYLAQDDTGNVHRRADGTDRVYGPGNELREVDGATWTHNALGQLVERRHPDGSTWRFAYNGAGRLARVERPDGQAVEFAYDAFGRRIRKRFGGRDTRWVWDGDKPLHEAADGEAEITWVFEQEGFGLLARVQDGRFHGALTDALGTPRALFNEAGSVAWRMQLDLYGVAEVQGDRTLCPFRWPGQYADGETGLFYNRHRYYDPGAGRYTTKDPLGLDGGRNAWAYSANPRRFTDPLGLSCSDPLASREAQALNDAERSELQRILHADPSKLEQVGKFVEMAHAARMGSVESKAVILWSGDLAKQKAAVFARMQGDGFNILEQTAAGRSMERLGGEITDQELKKLSYPLWSEVSSRYAKQADGTVMAFVNNQPRLTSVFYTTEMDRVFGESQNIRVMDMENAGTHGLANNTSIDHIDGAYGPGHAAAGDVHSVGPDLTPAAPHPSYLNAEQRQMMDGVRGLDTSTSAGRDTMASVNNYYAQGTPYGRPFTPESLGQLNDFRAAQGLPPYVPPTPP